MDFIEEVLTVSSQDSKRMTFSTIFAIISFYMLGFAFMLISISGYSFSELWLFIIPISTILAFLIGMKISKKLFKKSVKIKFENSKLYKKLKKNGDLDNFLATIDYEIRLENAIKYSSDITSNGLLMTESWFAFIDIKYPQVVKTNEIVKISEEFSTSKGKHFICLELRNNTYVTIERLAYDEIEEEIKNKYPYIAIGKGIIEWE